MNNYYIYIYLDPKKLGQYCYNNICFLYEPIYIGKGKYERWKIINKNRRSDYFIRKINKVKSSGLEPIILKLYENLNENQSFELEKDLIKEIGRYDLNLGTLLNMTDGGEGCSGIIFSKESKIKIGNTRKEKFKNGELNLNNKNNPMFGKHHLEKSKELMSKNKRKNFSEIKKEFKKRGYELLTEEKDYKNNRQKLKYICPNGHENSMSWGSFQQKHSCNICKNKLDEIDIIHIKLFLETGILSQQKIANIFNVDNRIISSIKTGKRWKYIKI